MSDSLERLYLAVIAAKDLDPATSRTARLFQRGPTKMAKKLAEEAIEVVIDAVNGNTPAVIRESADLLYNLTVLWASAGVRPDDLSRSKAAACASDTKPPSTGISRHGQIPSMVVHRAMLRRIYDWCIDAAHKPYALWILGAVAFAESSFFPVPPDVMLIPMSLARPERAWLYASVCTAASVLGGILGYAIGALLYDSIGHWLIQFYGLGGKVEAFRAGYAEYGAWIILLKGLTPIPYKLVTITSGFANYNIWLFVALSVIARGGRFFVVAILLNRYGEWIRVRIEKHLGLWVGLAVGVLVLGFIVAFRMI